MRLRSLRLRLGIAATGLIAMALVLAGAGLVLIFDSVLDAHTAADLEKTAKFLTGQVVVAKGGRPALSAVPPDPRYEHPYGGIYWQVSAPGGDLRSRSLWDKRLAVPVGLEVGGTHASLDLAGPDGGRLLAVALAVKVGRGLDEVPVMIVVALDRRDLAASRATYLGMLVPSLMALGIVLAAAMWVFVQQALRPFRALRADLRAVRDGRRNMMPTRFPDEVQPLVDDLNRLIGLQDRALRRARQQAGDMAHGLKTPLAVLMALSRRLADERPDLSRDIDEQANAMGRQVERSLLRARIAAAEGLSPAACRVVPVVVRLVAALRRLPDAASLSWEVAVDPAMAFPGRDGDLTEILGNLLDNARKWAHRRILVTSAVLEERMAVIIEDDGPGMSETAMQRVQRGRRWDETKPGTGFGIAIACDIAEEAGASVVLTVSDYGGLKASLVWPQVNVDVGHLRKAAK